MEYDEIQPVIIDNGSFNCRVGFGGDEEPKSIFQTVVGRKSSDSKEEKSTYIGNEAQLKRDILNLEYPIERGTVKNWDSMENIWNHTFYNVLRVAPEEHPVFHTDAPLTIKSNREKMTQIMFETFSNPCMYVENQSLLSLYSVGHSSGIILTLGGGISSMIPIFEGNQFMDLSKKFELAGCDLTNYMNILLKEEQQKQQPQQRQQQPHEIRKTMSNDIKEKFSFVSLNYGQELMNSMFSTSLEKGYQLPDGQILTIGNERFKCPELLFKPSLNGLEIQGIHELIFNSIIKVDAIYKQKQLYDNILLVGGTTLIPGLVTRLKKELKQLAPSNIKINVRNPLECLNSWIGGSIISSLSTFQPIWISKEEYDENGPIIVNRKRQLNHI